jgi:glucose-6-phosphate 1-dehydrogenase
LEARLHLDASDPTRSSVALTIDAASIRTNNPDRDAHLHSGDFFDVERYPTITVAGVDIVWDETVALEGRAGYYDHTGALRDMIQNHLLQLLCLMAMEQPAALDDRELRDRKVELLRSVRSPSATDVSAHTLRARHTAGRVRDRDIPDYADEPGVDPARQTETLAEVTLFVDNDRWRGVPFRLRTGRALGADCQEIASGSERCSMRSSAGTGNHP